MTIILSTDAEACVLNNYWIIPKTLSTLFSIVCDFLLSIGSLLLMIVESKRNSWKGFDFAINFIIVGMTNWDYSCFANNKHSIFSEAIRLIEHNVNPKGNLKMQWAQCLAVVTWNNSSCMSFFP